MIEFAKGAIDEMTSSRVHKYFNINDGNAIFATVALFKNVFKLGDDIVCRITFDTKSKVKCSVVCCFFFKLKVEFYFLGCSSIRNSRRRYE